MRPFNFSAWTKFQDQPLAHPGKIFDRADNDGTSHVPVGGPAPYGRVLIRGPESQAATAGGTIPGVFDSNPVIANPSYIQQTGRHYTLNDSCCLPDKARTNLKKPDGTTFAAAGYVLPVDAGGKLLTLGVGMWTEHNMLINPRLAQPFGLGDLCYQPAYTGQIGIATEGRIWAYCETDIEVGEQLYFRTQTTSTVDGIQLLGSFVNAAVGAGVGAANFQLFDMGKVFRPGPAGGAFVLSLNGQK